jgi:AcrR family transcriptional regulator
VNAADQVAAYRHGQVPRAIREEQLLDIAEALFVEHGFAGTSIGKVAECAGVSRPIVYEHFGSKEGLFLAVLARIRDVFEAELIAAAAGQQGLRAQLEAGSRAFFQTLQRSPERWMLVYGGGAQLVGSLAEAVAVQRERTVAAISALLRSHLTDAHPGQVQAYAHAASGAGEQLGRYWIRHRDIPLERIVEHHVAFCWPALEALQAAEATT